MALKTAGKKLLSKFLRFKQRTKVLHKIKRDNSLKNTKINLRKVSYIYVNHTEKADKVFLDTQDKIIC